MKIQIEKVIFYSITLLCSIIQICVSLYVLLLIIVRRIITREHYIDYLLYANTYIAALIIALVYIDICSYSIYGQIYADSSFDGWWCKTKGYLIYIAGCAFFSTSTVQAFYRLCRILYRTKLRLQSFYLYLILSISIWILSTLNLLPSFLIGDIEYMVNDYHCQFAPTSIRGSLTVYSIGFLLPFSVTVLCYTWTIYNVRKQTVALVTINQQISNQRDMTILKRLVIFLAMTTMVSAPHVYLPVIYIITGYLPSWIVSLECLLTELAVLAVIVTLLFISPHLKQLCVRQHVIHPVTTS